MHKKNWLGLSIALIGLAGVIGFQNCAGSGSTASTSNGATQAAATSTTSGTSASCSCTSSQYCDTTYSTGTCVTDIPTELNNVTVVGAGSCWASSALGGGCGAPTAATENGANTNATTWYFYGNYANTTGGQNICVTAGGTLITLATSATGSITSFICSLAAAGSAALNPNSPVTGQVMGGASCTPDSNGNCAAFNSGSASAWESFGVFNTAVGGVAGCPTGTWAAVVGRTQGGPSSIICIHN